MRELLGRTVRGLYIDDDESYLLFDTPSGTVAYRTFADCCSDTWFADILGVRGLLGRRVSRVVQLDLSSLTAAEGDGRTRQEVDEVYGWRLCTDVGTCEIIFRNSSNGYYGGNLGPVLRGEPIRGERITEDWSS